MIAVKRLGYALGAAVTGIDLSRPLSDEAFAEIRRLWLEHLLLSFPGQKLTDEQAYAFARRFEDPSVGGEASHHRTLTNQPVDGKPWSGHKNGQNWHSDDSFTTNPAIATFLYCRQTPAVGGDTMFANMYLAYESLSPAMQRICDGLSAIHVRGLKQRFQGVSDEQRAKVLQMQAERTASIPPVVQPVVRSHPEIGRRSLYMGERVTSFLGMTDEESQPLVEFLNAHATRYEFLLRYRWSVDDMIVWDNRCTMHIALCDYDIYEDPRTMFRAVVKGPKMGYHIEEPVGFQPAVVKLGAM